MIPSYPLRLRGNLRHGELCKAPRDCFRETRMDGGRAKIGLPVGYPWDGATQCEASRMGQWVTDSSNRQNDVLDSSVWLGSGAWLDRCPWDRTSRRQRRAESEFGESSAVSDRLRNAREVGCPPSDCARL